MKKKEKINYVKEAYYEARYFLWDKLIDKPRKKRRIKNIKKKRAFGGNALFIIYFLFALIL